MKFLEQGTKNRERGMAAFAVTGTIVLVVMLIVTGFSLVARRAAQQALDQQLSQQALRAAESGVDMAAAVLRKKITDGATFNSLPDKPTCAPATEGPFASTPNFPEIDTKVTCLIVQKGVDVLSYSSVLDSSPTVVPLATVGDNLSSLSVKWSNPNEMAGSVGCADDGAYARPSASELWTCRVGILRLDIAPRATGTETESKTVFVYPYTGSSASVGYGDASMNGGWAKGGCTGNSCQITINGLPGGDMYVAVRSLYRTSDLKLNGTEAGSGAVALFTGQAVIDSTARAVDTIKRVRANVSLGADIAGGTPGFAIDSQDSICKRFTINQHASSDLNNACN